LFARGQSAAKPSLKRKPVVEKSLSKHGGEILSEDLLLTQSGINTQLCRGHRYGKIVFVPLCALESLEHRNSPKESEEKGVVEIGKA
jgi:hypothetical protein